MIDAFNTIFNNKQKIMVVMAHPDDAELYAGGTIARLLKESKDVQIVKVTMGERGSRQEVISQNELSLLRLKEDTAAMKELGITEENNVYLNFLDGSVDNSIDIIKAIAEKIRKFKPDIIITHNPEDIIIRFAKNVNWVNHRDHRNTGKSTIDAAYPYSRDLLFFPEQLKNNITPHICTEFLLVDYYEHADVVSIDIYYYVEKRVAAHSKHSSQYSRKDAQASADFFTKFKDTNKRFERFRYVIAD